MEEYILEECPICRGAGLLMHEGGWNVQVECADCSAHTVYVEYEDEDANGVGEVGNAKCGDIMKIYLKIEDDIIKDVKFETFGCGSAIASSSMATEMIKGKSIHEAMALTNKAVAEALDGLPAHKLHCSVLAEEAIKKALQDYFDRKGIPYDEKDFPACEHCAHCESV